MGSYTSESDLTQLELTDGSRTYFNGGPFFSEEGTIGILAGSTLGGGTFVNSLVCLPPPEDVRADWAARGLDGVDGHEFDKFVDAVWEQLGVNTEATVPNRSNELMAEALERTHHSWQLLPRNAGPHDPLFCGYCNLGCQRGEKNSTLKNYLLHAAAAGCRFVVDCVAERILVEDGRAAGVSGWTIGQEGARIPVTVRSPVVVAAAGGIGTPALLLRTGIGGPAVGKFLRLHPAWFVGGVHSERLDAWTGQIQSVVSFDFRRLGHGGGFLPECVILSPTFWASSMPWEDGEQHKRDALKLSRVASWHALTLDHGWGEVGIDAAGDPLVRWTLSDSRDRASAAEAVAQLACMHEAVGAEEMFTFDPPGLRWRRGDDFDRYLESLRNFDWRRAIAYSAHQMCSARMGTDRETSVANGDGELHDTPGVWIGDAAAMPSSPGVNPMITLMALAERTAARILAY
jgi:choline dehydrogenase-like flavoprotein